MIQVLSAPVSVSVFFDHKARTFRLKRVIFDGTEYKVKQIGYHMTHREGRILYHLFYVASDSMFLKLKFNTENLQWTLEELHDHEVH